MHTDFTAPNDFTAQIVTTYCLRDDFFRVSGYEDAPQSQMNTVEVITSAFWQTVAISGNSTSAHSVRSYQRLPQRRGRRAGQGRLPLLRPAGR